MPLRPTADEATFAGLAAYDPHLVLLDPKDGVLPELVAELTKLGQRHPDDAEAGFKVPAVEAATIGAEVGDALRRELRGQLAQTVGVLIGRQRPAKWIARRHDAETFG